jgi:hypothetical protein
MGERITLGSKVKDTVTGFEGTATARAEYLDGRVSVQVEALRDGKPISEWFPESRIVVVEG